VELVGDVSTGAGEYIVEFETPASLRMRVKWKGAAAPDWSARWIAAFSGAFVQAR
jgi:hypothetical protein